MKSLFFTLFFTSITFASFSQSDSLENQKVYSRISGFHSDSIDVDFYKPFSLRLNTILDRSAGVRVRQQGGVGSNYSYQLDGISGNRITFFVDGIPAECLGPGYEINNLLSPLVSKVEVYKGVTPIELGADAIGGAINIITTQSDKNYFNASYSYGSLNTHQAHMQGQWIEPKSGFTARLSSYFTHSDNNYKVWGPGVYYQDPQTGYLQNYTKNNPGTHFNDDISLGHAKVDFGFTKRSYADQLLFSVAFSELEKGIQTNDYSYPVYGKVRSKQQFLMPSLVYKKENLFTRGLSLDFFTGYSMRENILVDTSRNRYNWKGEVVSKSVNAGEMVVGGTFQTRKENFLITRFNPIYVINANHKISFNYLRQRGKSEAEESFSSIPYVSNGIRSTKNFFGLSYVSYWFKNRLSTNLFAKYHYLKAIMPKAFPWSPGSSGQISYSIGNLGFGLATSFQALDWASVKVSIEKGARMPEPYEAISDGWTVWGNTYLEPEKSLNINAGVKLDNIKYVRGHGISLNVNAFYRNIQDQIHLLPYRNGIGIYDNYGEILGKGIESELQYNLSNVLTLKINTTYFKTIDNPLPYITYKDHIPNQPYLILNGTLQASFNNVGLKGAKLQTYILWGYVNKFNLYWVSPGQPNGNMIIPAQHMADFGIAYSFFERVKLAFDVSNVLDQQVFDFYAMQRPGRVLYLKLGYNL